MKGIYTFIKKNKWISTLFAISLVIVISYILTLDCPELFDGAGEWFNLAFQFSVGYIINFMFYITQVYIPSSKREATVRECIAKRISNLVQHMDNLLLQLANKYASGHKGNTYTEEDFKEMLHFKFSDEVPVLNVSKATPNNPVHFTVREWIGVCIAETERDVDRLFKYYASDISVNLMETLEAIGQTELYRKMKIFLSSPCGCDFSKAETRFFSEYYQLMQKLREIKENDYS